MAISGFIVIGTGAYMSWKLKQEANNMLNVVRFPDPVNDKAPFWPINSANMNGKRNLGIVVDCSATAYHQTIPKASRWMNPNTGMDFTDTYSIRLRATSDFRAWPQFDAAIWVDEGYNYVMVYCGSPSQGSNAGVIFLGMADIGPDQGFVQAYR